jgi:exodeoxyribonuclease I
MTFIFYDTETTGLNSAFDQITQFAAIVTDDGFNVLKEINLRCRLKPHVIASPGAMRVTKVGPKAIQSAPLSCYEIACQIRRFIERHSPAILIGFNSISFDESMLRQLFFQTLQPTYLTNTSGNSRFDVLRLAHAVAHHKPEAIAVPTAENGNASFKLTQLMSANGLAMGKAHDAMADTRATLDLAKFLKNGAPEVWDDLFACRSRHTVAAMLNDHPLFLLTDRAFKKHTILAGAISSHPQNPAMIAVFDLEYDPEIYLEADQEGVERLLKASPRPIRVVRTNNLPIITPYRGQEIGVDFGLANRRLDRIRQHSGFAAKVTAAMAVQDGAFEDSAHVEQSIYGGFPSKSDSGLMETFHKAPWHRRYEIAQQFSDSRYQEFAERIIYSEAPDGLPLGRRTALESWHHDRHTTELEVPWLTVKKAQNELTYFKGAMAADEATLLAEIEEYLNGLTASHS